MNLQTAFNAARSALLVNSAETSVVSRNVAGAGVAGYARRSVQLESLDYGGVAIGAVRRETSTALRDATLAAASAAARDGALDSAFESLHQAVGGVDSSASPAGLMEALRSSLVAASAAPQDAASLRSSVAAASSLARGLNAGSAAIQNVRAEADRSIAAAVDQLNAMLEEFGQVDRAIVAAQRGGADDTEALDRRDALLTEISGLVGVSVVRGGDGASAIFTDSGVTLYNGAPRHVSVKAAGAFDASAVGGAVFVDGVSIAGGAATMPTRSGSIAGLVNIRDQAAPALQARLDEMARGLIVGFRQENAAGSQRTGLFAWSGGPGLPTGAVAGLAADISIDAAVDPAQGGDVALLRDGGIGGAAYLYNASGSSGFNSRLIQQIDMLDAPQSFSLGVASTTLSVAGLAADSIAWLEDGRKSASDASSASGALATQTRSALSNATGVNIDDQMSRMLDLEHSYQAAAKMMATVDSMYSALFNSVRS